MHMITRFSCVIGYVILVALAVMTTAASLEKQLEKDDRSLVQNLASQSVMLNDVPSTGKREKFHHFQKRQSFSVTQDLDALAEMLREAAMRRRLKNAIAFFNALKKRDVESTYGHLLPEQLANNNRK